MAGFVFQPKPEGDRYIQVNISYKRIIEKRLSEIKNLEALVALLSVLEYLAKCSLVSSNWNPSDPLPDSVQISGDCNFPRLDALLDGWLKPTSMRDNLNLLDKIGFISIDTSTNRRRRFITYHRGEVAKALANINLQSHSPKSGDSIHKSPEFGDSGHPPKFGDCKTWGETYQNLESDPSEFWESPTLSPPNLDPSRSLVDLLEAQQEDPKPLFSFSVEPLDVQDSSKGKGSAVPVEKITQADFEILQPGERQNFRLQGTAIALDPWILDAPSNQANVLSGRETRCTFDSEFCVFLTQHLAQSPHWQKRSDEPPVNSGVRQIKYLYAVLVGPQRDVEREKMQGLWDKWQASLLKRQRNEELRSAPTASVPTWSEQCDRVPFSQLPAAQQTQIRETLAKLKTLASVGSTRMPPLKPEVVSPSVLPGESVEPASRLEQIMGLADGPVRDLELANYHRPTVASGDDAIALPSKTCIVSIPTLS